MQYDDLVHISCWYIPRPTERLSIFTIFPLLLHSHAERQICMIILLFPCVRIINRNRQTIISDIDIHYAWNWLSILAAVSRLNLNVRSWLWILIDRCQYVHLMQMNQTPPNQMEQVSKIMGRTKTWSLVSNIVDRRCKHFDWIDWLNFVFSRISSIKKKEVEKEDRLLEGDHGHDQIITIFWYTNIANIGLYSMHAKESGEFHRIEATN